MDNAKDTKSTVIPGLRYQNAPAAIEWLIGSAASGDPTMVITGVDPALDPLRDDPRMQRLMDELGLPNGYDPAADTYVPEG